MTMWMTKLVWTIVSSTIRIFQVSLAPKFSRATARTLCHEPIKSSREIPEEIFLSILENLHPSELSRVVLVSHAFWRVALPFLWRTLPEVDANRHLFSVLPVNVIALGQVRFFCGFHRTLLDIDSVLPL